MYEAFYGLKSKPFQLNPDPRFYFSGKPHRRARSYLVYGVMRGEGFIVITGEVGAGKTTIVRDLLDSLENGSVVAAQLVSTQLGAEDALKLVCGAFGVSVKSNGKADMLMALEAYFITQVSQGKRCLLIVDEAQNLQPQAVEELRMLSNFQFGDQALLQTFLIGQPEFRDILQSPRMLQLRQRVTARCHLGPLDEEDTRGYVEHRLKCAGATDKPSFDEAIFAQLHHETGGIPRRINLLMDRLLLQGFLAETPHLTIEAFNEVVNEAQAEAAASPTRTTLDAERWGPLAERPARGLPPTLTDQVEPLDLDLDPGTVEGMSEQLTQVAAEQLSARLLRIERSVLRQERISLEILSSLRRIVAGARKGRNGNGPSSGPSNDAPG
ncbi:MULTISPECIES: XrtA/PEP-CTERM system-associated ATPase [Hydrogenophaga]|uniref:Secretion atpase, pep-cterm locus subfamily n=1 Tax=Hydrogenophaga intermedia TaxID=65786 RepID=A0A1L1PS96_HYDIT|nr:MULTISPECIES: XrtA/PEP-CTERM system-associated ATPase [Hydrogenophaga]AOS79365.1 ATPase [Hydrogenophaga sp. PBC]TMU72822.1 ATPase [Hydrogenophaga intermedia]CDN88926.1 Secretion atpase, pep-cterm locus subfamily [Hydrogenophaga intermedia]